MRNRIYLNLEILLYPFRQVEYNEQHAFLKILTAAKESDKRNCIEEVVSDILRDVSGRTSVQNLDEIRLLLKTHYPLLFEYINMNDEESSVIDVNQVIERLQGEYQNILNRLSKALITHRDGVFALKSWKNDEDEKLFGPYSNVFQKVLVFKELNRMIPIDVIVCNYLVQNKYEEHCEREKHYQLDGYYSGISLADKQLDSILRKGIGENHLHFGAVGDFSALWIETMNLFRQKGTEKKNIIEQLVSCIGHCTDSNVYTILSACIIREWMACFLSEEKNSFWSWRLNHVEIENDEFDNETCETFSMDKFLGISKRNKTFATFDLLWQQVDLLEQRKDSERYNDYIYMLFPSPYNINTYGENIFLFYALQYMNKPESRESEDNKKDILFQRLFWCYIRIKNWFFSKIVQQNGINGLDYFKNFYDKSSELFAQMSNSYKDKFRILFHNPYLRKVEIRISPKECEAKLKNILSAYKEVIDEQNEGAINLKFPVLGIVFHFIKKSDNNISHKCWKNNENRAYPMVENWYYGKMQEDYNFQMNKILDMRNKIPYLSNIVLGLDAASGENDTPVCIFAPIFDMARSSSSQPPVMSLNNQINGKRPLLKNNSLCFTFHAGEDFRHMLSGLRRIDEVIEHCRFHAGDRIGHGIVLGIDPEQWQKNNSVVVLPRGEYLENMLWVWDCLQQCSDFDAGLLLYLQEKIYHVAEKILINMNGINTHVLHQGYLKRFVLMKEYFQECILQSDNKQPRKCPKEAKKVSIYCYDEYGCENQLWDADKLAHAIHCVCFLKRFEEPVQVRVTSQDVKLIRFMQEYLLNKISKEGIVVEVNPTSNVVIGEMESLLEHQAYVLNPIQKGEKPTALVNINSDDPLVFNTDISNEIAYLYYGLQNSHISKQECMKWIDELRQNGLDTSFVEDVDCKEYYEQLKFILRQLK